MDFQLYRNKVGDNVVKEMNVTRVNSLGFVLDIIIGSKSLVLGCKLTSRENQRTLHKEASISIGLV